MQINKTGNLTVNTGVTTTAIQKKEENPLDVKDKVEIGAAKEDEAGAIHKTFRGLAKLAGGAVGIIPGATLGGIQGFATEQPAINVSPQGIRFLRTIGAGLGLAVGAFGGVVSGPLGIAAGAIIGPIIGGTVAGALPGIIDGLYTGAKGFVKGTIGGAKKGAEIGGKVVDTTVHYGKEFVNWFKPEENEPKPPKK